MHSRVPKVVQLFLLMLFCLRKRILDFQFTLGNPPFRDPPNVLFDGMGWDGVDGHLFCPFIFFIVCGYIARVYTYLYMY